MDVRTIPVELVCHSNCIHLSQIYTGFAMLAQQGRIRLRVDRAGDYDPSMPGRPYLHARIGSGSGAARIGFDVRDGKTVLPEEVAECDILFKRSFEEEYAAEHPESRKIRPLGLNYCVYGPGDGGLRRCWWSLAAGRRHAREALHQFCQNSTLLSGMLRIKDGRSNCNLATLSGPPISHPEPRVLFLTRVWETSRDPLREQINEIRAACVRSLRAEFGPLLTGGLLADPLSLSRYPDCVVDRSLTDKREYLAAVRESTICVATRGLKNSIGWSFGEFAALSKCIVSERLLYTVPGGFHPDRHYLEFESPEQCVSAVRRLVDDPALRERMMTANHEYYENHVRPDALVWNALRSIIDDNP